MARDLTLPPLDPGTDRVMVCGSPSMLNDVGALLDARGFVISPGIGEPGDYVIERAFVNRPVEQKVSLLSRSAEAVKPTLLGHDLSMTWGD
jgi:hypothetical protein